LAFRIQSAERLVGRTVEAPEYVDEMGDRLVAEGEFLAGRPYRSCTWRSGGMQLAATLLSSTSLGLAEIAERVGYGSETAVSRAYKRSLGVARAEWRRRKRGRGRLGLTRRLCRRTRQRGGAPRFTPKS